MSTTIEAPAISKSRDLGTLPLGVAMGAFLLAVAALAWTVVRACGGHLGPLLDDAYIQMAMAKNLAGRHVWGVNPWEFSPASSSVLWPPLLAIFEAAGWRNTWLPFAFNVLPALGILMLANHELRRRAPAPLPLLAALIVLALAIPLVPLVFVQMEHTLHSLAFLALVLTAATVLALPAGTPAPASRGGLLALLVCLATALRYESMFVAAFVCLLLLVRRRVGLALLVGAAAALPIVGFGLVSRAHGGYWLPNSLLVKGNRLPHPLTVEGVAAFVLRPYRVLGTFRGLLSGIAPLAIVPGVLIVWLARLRREGFWERWQLVGLLTLFGYVCHVQFGYLSLRYGAYLIACGVLFLLATALPALARPEQARRATPGAARVTPTGLLAALLPLVFVLPAIAKGAGATVVVPPVAQTMDDLEFHIGQFFREYYAPRRETVMLGELGAPSYLSDVRTVDLFGLGSTGVTRLMLENRMNAQALAELPVVRAAHVAVIPDTLKHFLGPDWVEVGNWATAPAAVPTLRRRETFFGRGGAEVDSLRSRFLQFSAQRLPARVHATLGPAAGPVGAGHW